MEEERLQAEEAAASWRQENDSLVIRHGEKTAGLEEKVQALQIKTTTAGEICMHFGQSDKVSIRLSTY